MQLISAFILPNHNNHIRAVSGHSKTWEHTLDDIAQTKYDIATIPTLFYTCWSWNMHVYYSACYMWVMTEICGITSANLKPIIS